MLKPSEFNDLGKGIDKILDIIELQIGQDVLLKKDIKEQKRRKTWYLDTSNFDLNAKKFLLRIREEEGCGEYDTTLKCRHPDRYMSASYDLSSPTKNLQIKFEEDITIPFVSKFSLSASFKENKMSALRNFNDLKHIFPNLNVNNISESESLKKVNNFEPNEISYKIGTIEFTNKKNVNLYINLWYLTYGDKKTTPLIVEFTFDYGAKDQSGKNRMLLEDFPHSIVRKADKFYLLLQKQKIADPNTTKTKTEYVYTYKQH
jgi:hypothetical protein